MDNEWKPNAPDMNGEFQKTGVEKSEPANDANTQREEQGSGKQSPITKEQINQLEKQRKIPVQTSAPSPLGGFQDNFQQHKKMNENEKKIKELKDRMKAYSEKHRRDFDKGRGR